MSIWKSPVFYFGVLLVMVVALALVAPFTMNWNAWKPEMEAYGRNLTGREVNIAGPVEVRLFPWPRLHAQDVRLANAEGFGEAPLLASDAVTLRLSLAGLFNASLDVEEIAFDGPQLNLVRDDAGRMNWQLTPDGEYAGLVSRVNLDRITVTNGSVWFEDQLHEQSASMTDINANVAGDALQGPWRMQGKAKWRESVVGINFSLGKIETGKPLGVAAAMRPDNADLPSYAIDGQWSDGTFDGKVRIAPQETALQTVDGKSSIDGAFKPLSLQADMNWTRDAFAFKKIRIAPADSRDSGTLIEGDADIALATPPKARVRLVSPRVNLDNILGAQSLARWRRGGLLDLTNGIFTGLPEKMAADFSLDVNVLTLGGQSLNTVRLRGVAERQAIRIHEATSSLPGRSRMRFDGVVFPASTGAELGGTLAFESFDARDFSSWAFPDAKENIAAYWQGARGRLKVQTNLNWSSTRVALQDTAFELDGQQGKAQAVWSFGEVPMIDAQVEMASLDLDSYTNSQTTILPADVFFSGLAVLPEFLEVGQKAEQRVTVQLQSFKLNGARASNVALDYEAGLSGIQLKALDIESIGGASLKGEGLVTNGQDGPLGEFDLKIKAEDLQSSLQMIGLKSAVGERGILPLLGATDATLNLSIAPRDGKSVVAFDLAGKSGPFTLAANGTSSTQTGTDAPRITTKIEVSMADANRLFQLYGAHQTSETGQAQLKVDLDGNRENGMSAKATFKFADTEIEYAGSVLLQKPFSGLDGTLTAKAKSLARLSTLSGMPIALAEDGAIEWNAAIKSDPTDLSIQHVRGEAFGNPFELSLGVNQEGSISVDAAIGVIDLKQVLSTVFMPWRGAGVTMSESYSSSNDLKRSIQAFVRPSRLRTGLGTDVEEAVVAVEFSPKGRTINIKSPGKVLSFDLRLEPRGNSFQAVGTGEVLIDVAALLKDDADKAVAYGKVKLAGQFSATGQSPAASIASLEGKGTFSVQDLSLTSLTIEGFDSGLLNAKQQIALAQVFENLMQPPGTIVGSRTGDLKLEGGELKFSTVTASHDGVILTLVPRSDLTVPDIKIEAAVSFRQRTDLPPVVVTYSGAPGRIATRLANSALAAELGYKLLAQELAALEKLQQDEAEAVKKQEQQRADDEARFAAFQSQRAELRNHLRVFRFHQFARKQTRENADAAMSEALETGDKINRAELRRGMRLRGIMQGLAEPYVQP